MTLMAHLVNYQLNTARISEEKDSIEYKELVKKGANEVNEFRPHFIRQTRFID